MSPKGTDERYQEWLERMEVPIVAQTSIEAFQDYLRNEFGITGDAQISALWSTIGTKDTYMEHGIHAVIIDYPWGREVRYGIQGMPGLWGWESLQEIIENEEW